LTLAAVVLAGGLATTAAGTAGAATAKDARIKAACYDTGGKYTATGDGVSRAYWPATGWKYGSTDCADVNLKTNYTRTVRVCWKDQTCTAWETAPKGQWTAIHHVPDGWGFFLEFQGGNNSTGYVAY
jgi:hypothetical protein